MSDRTLRDEIRLYHVIEEVTLAGDAPTNGSSLADRIVDAIVAADDLVIVPKPSGDRVEAAIDAIVGMRGDVPELVATALAAADAADGRVHIDLDETVIAEALRVSAERSVQFEGTYSIEGYTDTLAQAVVAALKETSR